MKIDMHVHTKYSPDASSSLEKIIYMAKKKGLDGIAITDHNTTDAFQDIKKEKNFFVIRGEEVKILENNKKIGEVLVYFIEDTIKPGSVEEVFDQIKKQDAFVSAAHPFGHYYIDAPQLEKYLKKVDALEVANGISLFQSINKKAFDYAKHFKKAMTAGSDAHAAFGIGSAYVEAEASSLSEFRKKLEKGRMNVVWKGCCPIQMFLIAAFNKRIKFIFQRF